MINNGTLHYDHDRDGTHTQLAGCEAKFRNLDYDTHISIKYERDTLTGMAFIYIKLKVLSVLTFKVICIFYLLSFFSFY